jgi:hypothetical protein
MVDSADDIPKKLPHNGVVLVGEMTSPKWMAFDCPCRGGHRIMLNADKIRWPYWIVQALKPMTISPSIDSKEAEKRCHYFIRKGRVQWVVDDK